MMEKDSHIVDKTGHPINDPNQSTKSSGSSCAGIGKAQDILAKKLEDLAATINEKSAGQDEQSDLASYGREASEILHQAAGHIREFDYDKTEADVRGYIQKKPEKALMIAGGVGLLIGLFLRRR